MYMHVHCVIIYIIVKYNKHMVSTRIVLPRGTFASSDAALALAWDV